MDRKIALLVYSLFGGFGACIENDEDELASQGSDALPIGQPSAQVAVGGPEITNIDVSRTNKRRFGAPHVAVNPTNPDNIIVLASMNLGYTRECVALGAGGPCEMVSASLFGLPVISQARGMFETPGFADIGVFVSMDRGKSWKTVDVAHLTPPGHPEISSKGEGPVTVTADGTFYIGFNAINWGSTNNFFPNGGVGAIKSTDGGLTWTWGGLTQTPADWPYGEMDISTGTFYMISGLPFSTLGARSTGQPTAKEGTVGDRWVASSRDGVKWTKPAPLGGPDGTKHLPGSHSAMSAANGIMATMFQADRRGCEVFTKTTPTGNTCVVFQTSTDAGANWSRNRLPIPANFVPAGMTGLMFAADPAIKGHFTVALQNQAGTQFMLLQTFDSGKTWGAPITVTDDATKTHFSPWVTYSPNGQFGLMWRTYERDSAKPQARPPFLPYSVWAVVSTDGGKTFSKPLKVSKANSPAPPNDPKDAFSFLGDHGPSGMALDGKGRAYVVWADWTSGERAITLAAVDIEAFKN